MIKLNHLPISNTTLSLWSNPWTRFSRQPDWWSVRAAWWLHEIPVLPTLPESQAFHALRLADLASREHRTRYSAIWIRHIPSLRVTRVSKQGGQAYKLITGVPENQALTVWARQWVGWPQWWAARVYHAAGWLLSHPPHSPHRSVVVDGAQQQQHVA